MSDVPKVYVIDIEAPHCGAKFWYDIRLVERDDLLYFGLRFTLDQIGPIHGPAAVRQRLATVGERIFTAGFQFEHELRKNLGDQFFRDKRSAHQCKGLPVRAAPGAGGCLTQ